MRVALGVLLLAGCVQRGRSLDGAWRGRYVCTQGATGLELSITERGGDALAATFHFFGLDENPAVPSGAFKMEGTRTGRDFSLYGREWLAQPKNYVTVDLTGALAEDGKTLTGTVDTAGCTTFELKRQ